MIKSIVGQTSPEFNGCIEVKIGSKYVLKTQQIDNKHSVKININDFVGLMMAAYHEKQHVQQYEWYITRTDDTTLKMAIEESAHYYNRNFYLQSYHDNLYEIDAECVGIRDAYHHFTKLYGEQNANDLIMHYIDERQQYPYFISEQCNNVREVLNSFDKKFYNILNHHHPFTYKPVRGENGIILDNQDAFYQYILKNDEIKLQTHYLDITNGWEQRQFMCVTNVKYCGHYSNLSENIEMDNQ